MNYYAVLIAFLFIILISLQYSLNKIIILLKDIISILVELRKDQI